MSETRTDPDASVELEADRAAAAAAEEREGFQNPIKALAQGELGSLRVIIVLAIIWIIFQTQNDKFLSSINLTNLFLQIAAVGTISIGVTLVLLLGEIDLSVGSVSGLCASITAVLSVKNGWDPALAMVAGLAAGAAIGLFNGFFICIVGVPSFVVTLAGLLGWLGVQLAVLGDTGTVNLPVGTAITDLTGKFFSETWGWILAFVAIGAVIGTGVNERVQRRRAGLPLGDPLGLIVKTVAVSAALLVAVYVLNDDRGVPRSAIILVVLVAVMAFLTTRTGWGRHLYATGGNEEAARRAGINTTWVRMSVFILASTFAAAGGILAASRLLAVNQTSGGSDLLLFAIAGPVVAGVSLFGGRGTVWAALLGALVIGSIQNGMDLLALQSSDKYIITGAVLLAAITFDALTRKRRQSAIRT